MEKALRILLLLVMGGSGGGGSRGTGTALFGPRCRLSNIGPKVGTPDGPPFLLVNLRLTPPPLQNHGSAPANGLLPVTTKHHRVLYFGVCCC